MASHSSIQKGVNSGDGFQMQDDISVASGKNEEKSEGILHIKAITLQSKMHSKLSIKSKVESWMFSWTSKVKIQQRSFFFFCIFCKFQIELWVVGRLCCWCYYCCCCCCCCCCCTPADVTLYCCNVLWHSLSYQCGPLQKKPRPKNM